VPRSDRVHGIGEIVDGLLAERPLATGVRLGHLAAGWEGVVGPKLASVTAPTGLEKGTLRIRATTSSWAAQVRFLGPEIARAANVQLGEQLVANVQVSVGF
jgi:predicted nucleic acid-binding Zn ribbon protein